MTPKTSSETRPNFSDTPTSPYAADSGREAIWKVVHAVWRLLDEAETDSSGTTAPDRDRWREVADAMDELEALVPEREGPFWGGFPVNYLWPKPVARAERLNHHMTCATFSVTEVPVGAEIYAHGPHAPASHPGDAVEGGGEGPLGEKPDSALRIALDLHAAYEQLIYGLPRYLDAKNLTDDEGMIRKAYVTLDVTAHRLAALQPGASRMTDISQKQGGWTPGQERWEVGRHPAMSNGWIVRPVLFGSRVSVLPECEGGHIVIKDERVARLIAAAPDLYEALQAARDALHQHYVDWDGEPEDAVPLQLARAKADAALSRANPSTDQGGES